jgi:hypothetical protein
MTLDPSPPPEPAGGPVPVRTGDKIGFGCLLVPVAFFFVSSAAGAILCAVFITLGDRGPWKGLSPAAMFGGLASAVLMALFMGRVAHGLWASMRGRRVEHLIPPWLTITLSALLGLASLGSTIVGLVVGGPAVSVRGGFAGFAFLAYAIMALRKRFGAKP